MFKRYVDNFALVIKHVYLVLGSKLQTPGRLRGQPAAGYARSDPAMDPETRDPRAHPGRGPTEPGRPGPAKQPPGLSWHTPNHPALDTENHQHTSRQRHPPPAGSVAGRK
ncbi:hypothetical protein AMECASPLE_037127 [Ameca splendens]|uniref:Uncharacterized protein n=1 Tax=Ameca splendens TaxID=208324 RepID=A0ABV0ZTD6_9TELE